MRDIVLYLREQKWLQFLIFVGWELIPNVDFYYHMTGDVDWELVRQHLPMLLMSTVAVLLFLLYINTLANFYISERKRKGEFDEKEVKGIIEKIDTMIKQSNLSKIEVLLTQGSNAGAFAMNLHSKLKERGYDTDEIDSIMFTGPTKGISYAIYEGKVRIVLGILD